MKAKIVSDQHLEFRAAGGSYRKYFQAIHPPDGETPSQFLQTAELLGFLQVTAMGVVVP